jgi:hypothetical protein
MYVHNGFLYLILTRPKFAVHDSAVTCSYPALGEISMDILTYFQITKPASSIAKPLYEERRLNEH